MHVFGFIENVQLWKCVSEKKRLMNMLILLSYSWWLSGCLGLKTDEGIKCHVLTLTHLYPVSICCHRFPSLILVITLSQACKIKMPGVNRGHMLPGICLSTSWRQSISDVNLPTHVHKLPPLFILFKIKATDTKSPEVRRHWPSHPSPGK